MHAALNFFLGRIPQGQMLADTRLEGTFVVGDGRQEAGVESVGFHTGTQTAIAGETGGNMQRKPHTRGVRIEQVRVMSVYCSKEAGFDHRIGHFRPPANGVRILTCPLSLRREGLVLATYRLGWPTLGSRPF